MYGFDGHLIHPTCNIVFSSKICVSYKNTGKRSKIENSYCEV